MYKLSPRFTLDDIGAQMYLRPRDPRTDSAVVLNDSSQFIVHLISQGITSLNDLATQFAGRYELSLAQATEDLTDFLTHMVLAGVIEKC